jgi:hypothetical protein
VRPMTPAVTRPQLMPILTLIAWPLMLWHRSSTSAQNCATMTVWSSMSADRPGSAATTYDPITVSIFMMASSYRSISRSNVP